MSARGASASTTPVSRQRVRTGCQTCRRRRRKCDERKPRCEACELKGLACKYGTDLTFVLQNKYVVDGLNTGAIPTSRTAADDTAASERAVRPTAAVIRTASSSAADEGLQQGPSRGSSFVRFATAESGAFANEALCGSSTGGNDLPYRADSVASVERPIRDVRPHASPSNLARTTTPSSIFTADIGEFVSTPRSSSTVVTSVESAAGSHHETGLLCEYRYGVAPCLDIGDPKSYFGIRLMLVAKESKPILAVICLVAASRRALLHASSSGSLDPSQQDTVLRYRQEIDDEVRFVDEQTLRVCRALLFVEDIYSANPLLWRALQLRDETVSGSPFASLLPPVLTHDLDEALFWLCFKIDLAASISAAQPPLLAFDAYFRVQDDGSAASAQPGSAFRSAQEIFQHSLFLLGSTLRLVFGNAEPPPPVQEFTDAASFAAARGPSLSARWTRLWTNTQRWYANRPADVQPVVEVRGMNVSDIDLDDSSSFPILVYTTPVALVANAVYHVTSLLLLTHRPRLLKTLSGPRSLTSHIWHAQSIAGIAANNEAPEQWDPLLIAGLHLAAKGMTHAAQQTAVLARLRRISQLTGIKLEREEADLRAAWSIVGYNEEAEV